MNSILKNSLNYNKLISLNKTQINRVLLNSQFSTSSSLQSRQNTHVRLFSYDFGVFDSFIPLNSSDKPSILTEQGRKIAKKHFRNFVSSTFSIANIKMKLKGWKPKVFANEALDLYLEMNSSYAKGNTEAIDYLCTPSLAATMKKDIKARKDTFQWNFKDAVEPPKVINARIGRIADGMTLAQVTVKFNTLQSMGVFNKSGKLVAGDPKNFQPIVEYYVLQRMISKPKDSHWQLYSKISPQSVEEILKN